MDQSLQVLIVVILCISVLVFITLAHKAKSVSQVKSQNLWKKIEKKYDTSSIIKADSILDFVMQKKGIKGETTGERLNNSGAFIRDLNGTWEAHKLRNKIAHEPDIVVSDLEVKNALNKYKKALKDLGAL